jgi:ammonium transporter, Amt family
MKFSLRPVFPVLLIAPAMAWCGDDTVAHASVDTVWVVTAAALVFLMQAGFAFLESGMTRAKNTVNVIMKNYMDLCYGSLIFWLCGFGIMFGSNPSGFFGIDHFMPTALSEWDYTQMLFQMMFAATATTIVSGAMAERTHYTGYLLGACFITGLIYPVFGSWAWGSLYGGNGWLKELGFIDFAGSTVVHSIGGWCALAGIIMVGPRLGRFGQDGKPRAIPGHNLTLVGLGAFILWFGWFGFNGGSTLKADVSIGKILLNTHIAACAGAVSIATFSLLLRRPVLLTNVINGSLGGLVAITAGCATMDVHFAILTGLIAGLLTLAGSALLQALQLDDVVDAVSVHGICGAWGTLAAGLFFADDLFNRNIIIVQLIGILTAFLWAFFGALFMYACIKFLAGLRAEALHEQRGLDFTEHAEIGYPEFQQILTHNRSQLDQGN